MLKDVEDIDSPDEVRSIESLLKYKVVIVSTVVW